MTNGIRQATILGLALLCVLPDGDTRAQDETETMLHMHEHLVRLTDIKAAILIGELDDAREPAEWLADHEPMEDLQLIYEPFVLSMREHALEIVDARDIKSAAQSMAAIATDCASCHIATQTDLKFGFDEEPPAWSDMTSHMQRHQWAVDRLWEGLIGPSDASWARGIRMMAEAPLHGTENTWDEETAPDADKLATAVHELGVQAASALTPDARSQIYGSMIGVCAECHSRTGGGPRAD